MDAALEPNTYTVEHDAPGSGSDCPATFTAAELRLQQFKPIRYIVPGYLAEGCTLLAGRPKLGKSWLMLDIAIAVAAGRACLGNVICEQGEVLYLALEDNKRRLQSRFDKLLSPLALDWPAALHLATDWRRANEGGIVHIRDWIEAHPKARLVIVDVLQMFKPARGDKDTLYEGDYKSIKGLQALAGEFGLAIVVVHHTRKSAAENDPFEKVSGTLGLSGAADTVVILDRDSKGATLYGRGRDIEEFDTAVTFDSPSCRWAVLGDASKVRQTDERGAILAALDDATELMTSGDLSDATHMPNPNVRQLLVKMVKGGEVTKVSRGRYAHPDRVDLHGDRDQKRNGDHIDHKITSRHEYRAADGDDRDD